MSRSCKICDKKRKQKKCFEPSYAHLVYSAESEQVVFAFPQQNERDVVEFNQTLFSKNITHPVNGDNSKFRIEKKGIYDISWILNTVAKNANQFFYVGAAFEIIVNGVIVPPGIQHFGTYSMPINTPPEAVRPQLNGQTLLKLKKGDILQLRFIKGFGTQVGLPVPPALEVHLTENFTNDNAAFNCVGASLIIKKIDKIHKEKKKKFIGIQCYSCKKCCY